VINYGRQTLVPNVATPYNTSPDLEYVQIINESPYILTCTFRGMGFMDIPSWHKEDVYVNKNYNGLLDILPNNITTGQTSPPSTVVSVNGFAPGEIAVPKSVALDRLISTTSQAVAATGLVKFVDATGSQHPTLTLPNKAGQLLILDGWTFTGGAGTGTSGIAWVITVNAIVASIDYQFFLLQGNTVLNVLFTETYAPRGLQQAAGTDITLVTSGGNLGAAGNMMLVAKYHYETNF
jgi:hypothetical protein